MDLRENIQSHFEELGFEVPENILDKCVEICVLHNIDAETFAETWAAYSITNLGGEGPTLETLLQMERKELAGHSHGAAHSRSSNQPATPLATYSTPLASSKMLNEEKLKQSESTSKGIKQDQKGSNQMHSMGPQVMFSPASFSPVSADASAKYSARTNAGDAVCSFLERSPGDWTGKDKLTLAIASYRDEVLSSRCRVMMEPLVEKASVLSDVIERVSKHLVQTNQLPEPSHNQSVNPTEAVYVGRVCCDSNDRLNASSVILEGSHALCLGQTVSLDLSRLKQYSLFPGQVVAVQGVNPTGKRIVVSNIFSSAPLPLPAKLPRLSATMEVVIAAGPFTQVDSLEYKPLDDLITYVKAHRPHVLILIGPLVDIRQQQVSVGTIAESYEDLYNRILAGIINTLKGLWTQVVVVSSACDAVCLPLYPTPPSTTQVTPSSSLHLFSDPALLSINGFVIGVTATDSLMHLGKEEISLPPGGSDRLGRLASHLLNQQSFYPLYPPCEELSVDYGLWECFSTLPVTPHVLVTPSNFRHFIKQINGCLVMNPESLVKGTTGGQFARLEVEPAADDIWTPATHISAQIIKI